MGTRIVGRMRSSPALLLLLAAALAAPTTALADDAWSIPPDGASHPASSWPHATPFEMLEFTFYDDEPDQVVVASDRSMDDVVASYDTAPRAGLDEIVSARTAPADRWVGTPGVVLLAGRRRARADAAHRRSPAHDGDRDGDGDCDGARPRRA